MLDYDGGTSEFSIMMHLIRWGHIGDTMWISFLCITGPITEKSKLIVYAMQWIHLQILSV